MILIASSFALLVIVAGMFLLAKTQKEGLSNMFKYVSYFVIACGFFSLFAGGAGFIIRKCMMHCRMENKMNCEREHESCSRWGHNGTCEKERECDEESGMCIRKEIIVRDGQDTTAFSVSSLLTYVCNTSIFYLRNLVISSSLYHTCQ